MILDFLLRVKADTDTCKVTLCGDRIMPGDRLPMCELNATLDNPLWIRSHLIIPVVCRGETKKCVVSVTDTIENFLHNKFGVGAFAVHNGLFITNVQDTFMASTFDENCGFRVENRMVKIQKEHKSSPTTVDLHGCITIGQVVDKLGGSATYYNLQLLPDNEELDDFIIKTPPNRCIYITIPSSPITFALSESVSSAAKSGKILNNTISYGVYSHYLALEIYNNWVNKCDNVCQTVEKFQQILSYNTDELCLAHEELYTSLLSRVLDAFVSPFGCMHQMCLKQSRLDKSIITGCFPDFYCAVMKAGVASGKPLLVSDFRIDNYELAIGQSFGYCLNVAYYSSQHRPILAMPGTNKEFALYLCFVIGGDYSKLVIIEIGKADVDDTEKMTCLLTALKYGIEKIAETNYNKTLVVEPWQGKTLNFQLNRSRRVFVQTLFLYIHLFV